MRKFGASEEIIAKKLGSLPEQNVVVFEVLTANVQAIDVFQQCQPQMFAGMSSFVWAGISASELLAACQLLLVKRKLWPQIAEDVQFMGSYAARLNNSKTGRTR